MLDEKCKTAPKRRRLFIQSYWYIMRLYSLPLGTLYWARWRLRGVPVPWGLVCKAAVVAVASDNIYQGVMKEGARRVFEAHGKPEKESESRMCQMMIWMVHAMRGGHASH